MKVYFPLLVKVSAFRGGSVSAVPFQSGFLVKTRQIQKADKCGPNQVDQIDDLCIEERTKFFNKSLSHLDELVIDVPITWDDGSVDFGLKSRQMIITNDTSNSTPQVTYPPLWVIRGGCDEPQVLQLEIEDIDGDRVLCNYGYPALSGDSSVKLKKKLKSIQLDEENCKLTYYPSLDNSAGGYKIISLVIEDYQPGEPQPKSSSTMSFLAKVDQKINCNSQPIINFEASKNNFYYYNKTEDLENFVVSATSAAQVAQINVDGSSCRVIKRNDTTLIGTCSLTSSESCVSATDLTGTSSTLCVQPYFVAGPLRWNIKRLAFHYLSINALKLRSYGCSGRGFLDSKQSTIGKPVDNIDRLFHEWKSCRKCAGTRSLVTDYYFVDGTCGMECCHS